MEFKILNYFSIIIQLWCILALKKTEQKKIKVIFTTAMEKRKNFTSKIKAELVLSLLRGEDPELISREYGVTLADINLWRDQFIESGTDGFKRKPDDSKLSAAERKIGQLQMELELTKKKNELAAKLKRK